MKKTLRLLLLAGLGYLPASYGLDLIGVYDMAREKDPEIRRARDEASAARESKPQAKALLLPNLSIGGEYDWVDQDTTSSPLGRTGSESFTQYDADVSLTQSVYQRDLWIQLEQADDTIAQAEAGLADAEIELMVRTTTAYFDVLLAAEGLRTAIAEKDANERQLEQSQQRFDVGLIAITDVHESQAAYDNALAAEIEAENNLSNQWEALREIVGDIKEPIAKLGDKLPLAPPEPNDEEQWAQAALKQNYGIIAAREGAEIAKKNIEVQRSGLYYPVVDLVAQYGTQQSDSNFSTDRDTGIIGLQVEIPLYQGGGVTSRTRQARYEYQAAMESLDGQRRAVNRDVRDAYRGVLSNISRVKALQSTVVSFQSALESTTAGLEVGTRTMVDVLTVTGNLYNAERDYLASRNDYIISGLKLHQAASTLTPELLRKANGWLDPDDTIAPPG